MIRPALCFALVLFCVSRALAWGPFTHAALSESLLERIGEAHHHPLAFLTTAPYRTLFVRASLSPDMTLSAFAGKKVNPVYNKLFHDRAIGRAIVQAAWEAHDLQAAAFGLGWLGHAVSDNRMSKTSGSVIYHDLFGLPVATRKKLASSLNAINKICIDAFLMKEEQAPEVEPYVDEAALAAALKAPIAARHLAVEPPETAIPGFVSSFSWACSSIHAFCEQVGTTKSFPALIEGLTERDEDGDRSVPGYDAVVEAMDQALSAAVRDAKGAGDAEVTSADPSPASDADGRHVDPSLGTRAARKARALAAKGSAFLWGGTTITRKIREAVLERSLQLVNSMGGDGSLGGRLLVTFAGDMLNETRNWPEVQAHLRKLAGAPDPEPDSADE